MYEELGFISVTGGEANRGYAYLLYPHRPIVAYETATDGLLTSTASASATPSIPSSGRLPHADESSRNGCPCAAASAS